MLGALVFVIAIRLIKLRTILDLRRESPGEFGLALIAAAWSSRAGVEQGILLAMILSLLRIVQHSYHPHTGVMTLKQDGIWQLNPVTPGAMTEPGLVLYRFEAELFYANVNRFSEEVRCLAGAAPTPVRWLIVDAESITHLDYSAARVIERLQKKLKSSDTELGFARMPFGLRADFARHRLTEVIDPALIFNRLHDALAAFEKLHNHLKSLSTFYSRRKTMAVGYEKVCESRPVGLLTLSLQPPSPVCHPACPDLQWDRRGTDLQMRPSVDPTLTILSHSLFGHPSLAPHGFDRMTDVPTGLRFGNPGSHADSIVA